MLRRDVRLWVTFWIVVVAAAAAIAAYFLPERETEITRDAVFQDLRDKAALVGLVNDFRK